jgi:hypothetical protein
MRGSSEEIIPGIQIATVSLTDSQIKALPTTPITFGVTSGTGFWNHIIAISYNFDTNAGAYTNLNTTFAALNIVSSITVTGPVNDSTSTPALTTLTTLLASAGKRIHTPLVPYSEGFAVAGSSSWVLSPVFETHAGADDNAFSVTLDNNGSGNLTGGNAANSLKIRVIYIVEPLT